MDECDPLNISTPLHILLSAMKCICDELGIHEIVVLFTSCDGVPDVRRLDAGSHQDARRLYNLFMSDAVPQRSVH